MEVCALVSFTLVCNRSTANMQMLMMMLSILK